MLSRWFRTAQALTKQADDPADIAYLLVILARIPRRELPEGAARQALAAAIRAGRVDNLYRPIGADAHNIAWRDRPAWVDPCQHLSDFVRAVGEQVGQGEGQGE